MDSNRIKRLATGAREALRNEVSARLDAVLAEGSRERLEAPSQVRALETDVRDHGHDEVVDRAAYTWFNRLCALRFMDANGYTSTPVVTPLPGSTQPAVLADAAQGVYDPEYGILQGVMQRVTGLLAGAVASTNAAEEAYTLLLGAVCEHYAGPMGYLFADDVTSPLLMPQGLLAQGSILSRIVEEMDEEACEDVEVLGWLYQFYIAERKDEYFASRKKATAADIPAATQLFTPRWIVAYLTENSLGRLWMLNNPDSELAKSMDNYIAPEGDEPHIEVSAASDIRVLDPACGSGHILVYAFDLLFAMYEEEGWPTEDIPEMILRNNLFGMEIDRRAAEIASFALEMKARERDPGFFVRDVDAQIRVLEPVELLPQELELVPQLAERRGLLEAVEHMDEVGSLYVPDGLDEFVLQNELEHVEHDGSIFASSAITKLGAMLANVQALNQSFHCVIANPPYMGSGNMNPRLSGWVKKNYPDEKGDLCTCFIDRALHFTNSKGYAAIITSDTCMYLSSYEKMRRKVIGSEHILTFIDTRGSNAHPDVFDANAVWILQHKCPDNASGTYFKINHPIGKKHLALLEAIRNPDCSWLYRANAEDFKAIPGWLIAYSATEALRSNFAKGIEKNSLSDFAKVAKGITTGKNAIYLRFWWEVATRRCAYDHERNGRKWVACDKGGEYRKWYGNNEYVIDWTDNGRPIIESPASTPRNLSACFLPAATCSKISSGDIAFRHHDGGFVFTDAAVSVTQTTIPHEVIEGFCNSSVALTMMKLLAPTLNFEVGQIRSLPMLVGTEEFQQISERVAQARACSKSDWDAFETSWEFIRHPMTYIPEGTPERLSNCYARWETECRERFDTLKANEEELNRIFARIYHMEGEVPIEVPDDKVSVRPADRARDARSLVSYGIGCLLGRYSTYKPGLVLADQGATLADFEEKVPHTRFTPDEDNVLPVLSAEWFEDDIVTGFRTWLADAFGEDGLDENVAWLEESLGKDLRTYLVRDFYTDHLKTYQKRPIYWMFQSPKKSFQCLVYMHRYDEGTVGTILTGYLRPLEDKLRARLQALESPNASAADVREANKVRGMIAELEQWEREVIYPLAHERVSIDLDDGVKVNYNKFPRALAKVPGLSDWR